MSAAEVVITLSPRDQRVVRALHRRLSQGLPPERTLSLNSVYVAYARAYERTQNTLEAQKAVLNLAEIARTGQSRNPNPPDRDLLPAANPLSARHGLASHSQRAYWLSTDESLDDNPRARAIVASAFGSEPLSTKRLYGLSLLKMSASELGLSRALREAVHSALLADGNSRAARAARARLQLRDRYGRWIEMGRGLRFKIRTPGVGKGYKWYHGKSVGQAPNGNVTVELDDGRRVDIPASKVEQLKAVLPATPESPTKATRIGPEPGGRVRSRANRLAEALKRDDRLAQARVKAEIDALPEGPEKEASREVAERLERRASIFNPNRDLDGLPGESERIADEVMSRVNEGDDPDTEVVDLDATPEAKYAEAEQERARQKVNDAAANNHAFYLSPEEAKALYGRLPDPPPGRGVPSDWRDQRFDGRPLFNNPDARLDRLMGMTKAERQREYESMSPEQRRELENRAKFSSGLARLFPDYQSAARDSVLKSEIAAELEKFDTQDPLQRGLEKIRDSNASGNAFVLEKPEADALREAYPEEFGAPGPEGVEFPFEAEDPDDLDELRAQAESRGLDVDVTEGVSGPEQGTHMVRLDGSKDVLDEFERAFEDGFPGESAASFPFEEEDEGDLDALRAEAESRGLRFNAKEGVSGPEQGTHTVSLSGPEEAIRDFQDALEDGFTPQAPDSARSTEFPFEEEPEGTIDDLRELAREYGVDLDVTEGVSGPEQGTHTVRARGTEEALADFYDAIGKDRDELDADLRAVETSSGGTFVPSVNDPRLGPDGKVRTDQLRRGDVFYRDDTGDTHGVYGTSTRDDGGVTADTLNFDKDEFEDVDFPDCSGEGGITASGYDDCSVPIGDSSAGKGKDWSGVPSNYYKVDDDSFEPDPDVYDEDAPADFTDDPAVLAQKFSTDELKDALLFAVTGKKSSADDFLEELKKYEPADLPGEEDKKKGKKKPGPKKKTPKAAEIGSGSGLLEFNDGPGYVPAEALRDALNEQGEDGSGFLDEVYGFTTSEGEDSGVAGPGEGAGGAGEGAPGLPEAPAEGEGPDREGPGGVGEPGAAEGEDVEEPGAAPGVEAEVEYVKPEGYDAAYEKYAAETDMLGKWAVDTAGFMESPFDGLNELASWLAKNQQKMVDVNNSYADGDVNELTVETELQLLQMEAITEGLKREQAGDPSWLIGLASIWEFTGGEFDEAVKDAYRDFYPGMTESTALQEWAAFQVKYGDNYGNGKSWKNRLDELRADPSKLQDHATLDTLDLGSAMMWLMDGAAGKAPSDVPIYRGVQVLEGTAKFKRYTTPGNVFGLRSGSWSETRSLADSFAGADGTYASPNKVGVVIELEDGFGIPVAAVSPYAAESGWGPLRERGENEIINGGMYVVESAEFNSADEIGDPNYIEGVWRVRVRPATQEEIDAHQPGLIRDVESGEEVDPKDPTVSADLADIEIPDSFFIPEMVPYEKLDPDLISPDAPPDYTDDPQQLAREFPDDVLKQAFQEAVANGWSTGSLVFEDDEEYGVPTHALRDALIIQGANTNELIREAALNPEEFEGFEEPEVPLAPVPEPTPEPEDLAEDAGQSIVDQWNTHEFDKSRTPTIPKWGLRPGSQVLARKERTDGEYDYLVLEPDDNESGRDIRVYQGGGWMNVAAGDDLTKKIASGDEPGWELVDPEDYYDTPPVTQEDVSAPGTPAAASSLADIKYDTSGWTKVGGQGGSNPGGIYEAPDGTRFYVKTPHSDSHAHSEVAASAFYSELGIDVPEVSLARNGDSGPILVASRMIPGAQDDFGTKVNDPEYRKMVQDGMAVDAWLANWDVAGLVFDNVVTGEDGKPYRIDGGGALIWRAQGSPKGHLFGNDVTEIDRFRDTTQGSTSSKVFGEMTDDDVRESAKKLLDMSPDRIREITQDTGWDDATKDKVADTLVARREAILERFDLLATPEEVVDNFPEEARNDAPNMPNSSDELEDWEKELLAYSEAESAGVSTVDVDGETKAVPDADAADTKAVKQADNEAHNPLMAEGAAEKMYVSADGVTSLEKGMTVQSQKTGEIGTVIGLKKNPKYVNIELENGKKVSRAASALKVIGKDEDSGTPVSEPTYLDELLGVPDAPDPVPDPSGDGNLDPVDADETNVDWVEHTFQEEYAGIAAETFLTDHTANVDGYFINVNQAHTDTGWRWSVQSPDGKTYMSPQQFDSQGHEVGPFGDDLDAAKASALDKVKQLSAADKANEPPPSPEPKQKTQALMIGGIAHTDGYEVGFKDSNGEWRSGVLSNIDEANATADVTPINDDWSLSESEKTTVSLNSLITADGYYKLKSEQEAQAPAPEPETPAAPPTPDTDALDYLDGLAGSFSSLGSGGASGSKDKFDAQAWNYASTNIKNAVESLKQGDKISAARQLQSASSRLSGQNISPIERDRLREAANNLLLTGSLSGSPDADDLAAGDFIAKRDASLSDARDKASVTGSPVYIQPFTSGNFGETSSAIQLNDEARFEVYPDGTIKFYDANGKTQDFNLPGDVGPTAPETPTPGAPETALDRFVQANIEGRLGDLDEADLIEVANQDDDTLAKALAEDELVKRGAEVDEGSPEAPSEDDFIITDEIVGYEPTDEVMTKFGDLLESMNDAVGVDMDLTESIADVFNQYEAGDVDLNALVKELPYFRGDLLDQPGIPDDDDPIILQFDSLTQSLTAQRDSLIGGSVEAPPAPDWTDVPDITNTKSAEETVSFIQSLTFDPNDQVTLPGDGVPQPPPGARLVGEMTQQPDDPFYLVASPASDGSVKLDMYSKYGKTPIPNSEEVIKSFYDVASWKLYEGKKYTTTTPSPEAPGTPDEPTGPTPFLDDWNVPTVDQYTITDGGTFATLPSGAKPVSWKNNGAGGKFWVVNEGTDSSPDLWLYWPSGEKSKAHSNNISSYEKGAWNVPSSSELSSMKSSVPESDANAPAPVETPPADAPFYEGYDGSKIYVGSTVVTKKGETGIVKKLQPGKDYVDIYFPDKGKTLARNKSTLSATGWSSNGELSAAQKVAMPTTSSKPKTTKKAVPPSIEAGTSTSVGRFTDVNAPDDYYDVGDRTPANVERFSDVQQKMNDDKVAAYRGATVAGDGTDVEDMAVYMQRVIDEPGNRTGTLVDFTLTRGAGDRFEEVAEALGFIRVNKGDFPVVKLNKDGQAVLASDTGGYAFHTGNSYDSVRVNNGHRFYGTVQTSKGPARVSVQRADDVQKYTTSTGYVAPHNQVTVVMPEGADEKDLQRVFEAVGVREARGPAQEDFRSLAEGRIVRIFNDSTNTKTGPTDAAKKAALEKAEKYGITPDNFELITTSTGRTDIAWPREAIEKILADPDLRPYSTSKQLQGMTHNLQAQYSGDEPSPAYGDHYGKYQRLMQQLVSIVSKGGILSTHRRWREGIGGSGMSSAGDTSTGGAKYAFHYKSSASAEDYLAGLYNNLGPSFIGSSVSLYFDAPEALRGLNWDAADHDNWGKQRPGKANLSGALATGGEINTKFDSPLSALRFMQVGNKKTKDMMIADFEAIGITEIGGRPLNEVIVTQNDPDFQPNGLLETPTSLFPSQGAVPDDVYAREYVNKVGGTTPSNAIKDTDYTSAGPQGVPVA